MSQLLQIETSSGVYEFEEYQFEIGTKKINIDISKKNLLDVKSCLDKHGVRFGLLYGTLLGAVRENNFIAHDEDTDLYMFIEDKQQLLDRVFDLDKLGFKVGRNLPGLVSIIRNGEYIDFYFFTKKAFNILECEGHVIKAHLLDGMEKLNFLGEEFDVPKNPEKLLVYLYGEDWKIPKKNAPANNFGPYKAVRHHILTNYPFVFSGISWLKRTLHL